MRMCRNLLGLVILNAAVLSWESAAHSLGPSNIIVGVYDDSIEGRFEIRIPDLNRGLNFDFKEDRTATAADLDVLQQIAIHADS